MSQSQPFHVARIARWIRIGAAATLLALALCIAGWSNPGGLLAVVGLFILGFNLHRLGRSGPS